MCNLITKDMIVLDLEAKDKQDTIQKLARLIEKENRLNEFDGFIEQVNIRENQFPTSVGFSVAIPHGKTNSVKTAALAFARLKNEVKWSDEENTKYIFLIAVPEEAAGNQHLKILAQISRKIMREEFRNQLEQVSSIDEVLEMLSLEVN